MYCALVYLGWQRHLWFDELLTFHIARAERVSCLVYLVKRWDLNPPLSHFLAHGSLVLTGGLRTAVRLPSVIEFYLASLFFYGYSARKLGVVAGALPVFFLWYSPLIRFATEARPYALLLCFFCALLFLWSLGTEPVRGRWVVPAIAFSAAGLLSSHVLAPLSLFPFAVAEAVRFLQRRKPDYPLWVALFAPLVLVYFYLPFIASYQTITHYPLAFQAGWDKLASFYWHTSTDVLAPVCLAGAAAVLLSKESRLKWNGVTFSRPEWALSIAAAAVPLILDLIMMADHAPFWGRYCLTSAAVVYLLAAYLVRALSGAGKKAVQIPVYLVALLLTGARIAVPLYKTVSHPAPVNSGAIGYIESNLPLVAASGLTFVEMGEYENAATCSRLVYLTDRAAAIRFANSSIFDDLDDLQHEFHLRGRIEPYNQFVREHPDFLVLGTADYPEDWLLRKLASDGATISQLGVYPTPYKDKTLFRVHALAER